MLREVANAAVKLLSSCRFFFAFVVFILFILFFIFLIHSELEPLLGARLGCTSRAMEVAIILYSVTSLQTGKKCRHCLDELVDSRL